MKKEIKLCEVCLGKASVFKETLQFCKSCDNLFNKWDCENNQGARKELDRRAARTEMIKENLYPPHAHR